jgi:hypothetical protein
MQTRADTCFCTEKYGTSFEHKDHCNPKALHSSLQFQYQLIMKGTGRCLLFIPKLMTLNVIYNNPDHTDKAVIYADCHDITQYIFMANLKMEMGIENTNLRILST